MFELVNPHLLPVHVLIRNMENKNTKQNIDIRGGKGCLIHTGTP